MKPTNLNKMLDEKRKKKDDSSTKQPVALSSPKNNNLKFDVGYDDYLPFKSRILRFAEEMVIEDVNIPTIKYTYSKSLFQDKVDDYLKKFRTLYAHLRVNILHEAKVRNKKLN